MIKPKRGGGAMHRIIRRQGIGKLSCFLFVFCVLFSTSALAQTGPGNALSVQSNAAQYVTAAIPTQSSNYTISAWVFLRAGGNWWGTRLCVLGGSNTVEVLVRSNTSNNYDPQYLELGRWGVFNGQPSTVPVPTNEWVHLTVVVSGSKQISYFINGSMAGNWDGAGYDLSLGTTNILLGDNAIRAFNGVLDEVRIWNTARSQAEIQADMRRRLAGTEAGLLAYWRFDEAAGAVAINSATATGAACDGTLVNGPARVLSGIPFVPDPATLSATDIGRTNATLRASVHPGNLPTAVWFEWGATTNYGNTTAVTNLPATNTALDVQAKISGLSPYNTYHFRIVATNAAGAAVGANQSFVTLPAPGTHSPQGSNKTLTVYVGQTVTITKEDWGFSDPLDSPPDNFVAVTLVYLPAAGQVKVDGVTATNDQVVSMLPGPAGETWIERESTRSWQSVASSADGTKLVAAPMSGRLYTSTDSGVSWTPRDTNRGWKCVASSADGQKLVASVYGGRLYTSSDSGTNWTARMTDASRWWWGVASSADGTKLVATEDNGFIYTSSDSGSNWTARMTDTNRLWRGVASSADGTKLVAGELEGFLFTSGDSGNNWIPRLTDRKRQWISVASSADGTKLMAVATDNQYIYVSTDSGTNWTPRENRRTWYSAASSADGTRLLAGMWGGYIFISTDAGTNWTARMTDTSRWWTGAASSADGTKMVAAVNGGQLYTSVGRVPAVTYTAHTAPGTFTLDFLVKDDGAANNMATNLNTLTFDVVKYDQAPLVFTPASPQAYHTTNALSVTGGSGTGTVSYAVLSGPGAIVGGSNLTVTASTGVVVVVATKAGDSQYNATSATGTVVCVKGNQTINFPEIADQMQTNQVGLAATASSGLPVSFAVAGGPATITSGTNLTFTGGGPVWIVASQAGNANWNPAPNVTNTFLVFKSIYVPPQGSNKTFMVSAGQTVTVASVDWGFSDALDSPPDKFVAVRLTNLPAAGQMLVDGVNATNGQVVSMLPGQGGETWTERMTDTNRSWYALASSADGFMLAAGVYGGQIYTSTDAGTNWTERTTGLPRNWAGVASSADGMNLVAAADGWYVYTSTDAGINWTTGQIWQLWKSVASSADGTKLAAVAWNGWIYTSTNGGATWTARMTDTNRLWISVASSADGIRLAASEIDGWLYTSRDGGASWTARMSNRWFSIASSADGTKLVATAPPGWIYTSTDAGATWTARMTDSNRQWRGVASSADGSRLVAAEFGGQIYTSTDGGETWTARMTDTNRQWWGVASSADGSKLVAGVRGGLLYTSVGAPAPVITYIAPSTPGTYTLGFQVLDDGATNNMDLSPNTLTFNVGAGFWLDTEAGPNGSVNVGDQWVPAGVVTQITATAAPYYRFSHWTGSVSGEQTNANPLNLLMDAHKTVVAHFVALVTTNTGTPYWWFAQYGITQNFEAAALQDPNGNGYISAEDYILGLNPTNPASTFRPSAMQSASGMVFSWPSVSGRVYDIEAGSDLPGAAWAPLAGGQNLTATPPINYFTNPISQMTNRWQFYRHRVRISP